MPALLFPRPTIRMSTTASRFSAAWATSSPTRWEEMVEDIVALRCAYPGHDPRQDRHGACTACAR